MTTNYAPSAFERYAASVEEDMAFVKDLLGKMLADNPEQLVRQLRECEAWYAWLNVCLADANSFLDVAEAASLVAKDKSVTDLDRAAIQSAAVANQRGFRNQVEGMAKALDTRLMLGMAVIKHFDNERRGLGAKTGS